MKIFNKNIFIFFLTSLICTPIFSQVGINLTSPLSPLHIDGFGNNPTTGTPSAAQQLDDFAVNADNTGDVNVGVGLIPLTGTSAQLELKAIDKAFRFNRVALTSSLDKTTVLNPREGMMVYNTATAGTYPDNVIPGIHYFNGTAWFRLENTMSDDLTLQLRNLETNMTSIYSTNITQPPAGSLPMDFGNDIVIPESSGYAFSLRLYGRVVYTSLSTLNERSQFYVYLIRKDGTTNTETIESYIQINVPTYPTPTINSAPDAFATTYTITLGCFANTGDTIYFKLAHASTNKYWVLYAAPTRAAKTSLIYWKL